MKKGLISIALSILCLAVILCGCTGHTSSESQSELQSSQTILKEGKIGIQTGFSSLPVTEYPAYLDASYSCEIKEYELPSAPLEELLAGQIDLCVAPLSSILKVQAEGTSVKILCNFLQQNAALVASVEEGIETIKDLPSKTVGYTEGSSEYILSQLALQAEGIDSNTITWKNLSPSRLNEALKAGEIDAYCGDMAMSATAILEGFGKIISYPYQDALGTNNLVLATTESVITEKREWLQEIVNTHRTVIEMVAQNTDWKLSQAEKTGLSHKAVQIEESNFQWLWDMEEEYVVYTRNLASQMLHAGFLGNMPDLDNSFDFTFLEKTNQEFLS